MKELIRECYLLPSLSEKETYELLISRKEENIHKVILHNAYKVIDIVSRNYVSFNNIDDIFSCGLLGLTKAVWAYSVNDSFKLRNFDMFVRNYINREISSLLETEIPEDCVGDYHDVLKLSEPMELADSNQLEHNYIRREIIRTAIKKVRGISSKKLDIVRLHSLGYDHVEIGKKYKITGQAVFNHLESVKRIGKNLRGIGYSVEDISYESDGAYKRVLH